MGSRVGVIDPGAVLELVSRVGLPQADQILSAQSGLLGLSGLGSDMRDLAASDAPQAAFARDHFAYWAARQAGSMFAAMGAATPSPLPAASARTTRTSATASPICCAGPETCPFMLSPLPKRRISPCKPRS